MIVPAAYRALAKGLANGVTSGDSALGLLTTELAAKADPQVTTHYISAGPIRPEFAALLGDAQSTYNAVAAAAATAGTQPSATLQQIQAMYAASTFKDMEADTYPVVTSEGAVQVPVTPFSVIDSLNLTITQKALP